MASVTIKKETVFTLVVGECEFPDMRKVSDWEGFVKLRGPGGLSAILRPNVNYVLAVFADIFDPDAPESWELICASQEIHEAFLAAQRSKEAA